MHFELDAIDSAGNVKIGCHAIDYAEMTRLGRAGSPPRRAAVLSASGAVMIARYRTMRGAEHYAAELRRRWPQIRLPCRAASVRVRLQRCGDLRWRARLRIQAPSQFPRIVSDPGGWHR